MKAKLDTPIEDRFGSPILQGSDPLTLRLLLFTVLDLILDGDSTMAPADKLRLARAGHAAQGDAETIDLDAQSTVLVLERAAKAVNTNLYGQLVKLLDPAQLEA